jgi:hypothetical protein
MSHQHLVVCFKVIATKPGVMVHFYNLSTWEAEAGGSEFKSSLGYIMIPCLKKKGNGTDFPITSK